MNRCVLIVAFSVLCIVNVPAQFNAYARVTSVTNGSVLILSNINQAAGTFSAAGRVVVVQMQGASITNNGNNSSFGSLSSLNSAGLFEIAVVKAVNGSATSMTLAAPLVNNYSTSNRLQVVSYPQLGTGNYTTTSSITGLPWNGDIGGIVAFQVNGNLQLSHTISASGIGFRGGSKAQNEDGSCESSTWRTTPGNDRYAGKGEGIYIANSGQQAGRAKIVNGGGGGLIHNGGGGGGGNFTTGGAGFYGYDGEGCSSSNNAGGQGGLSIASNAGRVFMGGGGGGGQGNNSHATDGGNGGGIIFIRCDTIVVGTGVCNNPGIEANGNAGPNTTGHDGAGAGGGGGSVVLNIKGIRVRNGCNLTISANGGNGGNVIHADLHGSGGGGGQGTILLSAIGPFANTTLQTNNGIGGLASTSGGAPRAGNGGGANGAGIKFGQNVVLPVQLSAFSGREIEPGIVGLEWTTKTERNSEYFEVQRSTGNDWVRIGRIKAAGNSNSGSNYELLDRDPVRGDNYYRLRQVDFNGDEDFSDIIHVLVEDLKLPVRVYPNPASGEITIESEFDLSNETIRVFSAAGVQQRCESRVDGMKLKIDLTALAPGIYFVISERIREMVAVQ